MVVDSKKVQIPTQKVCPNCVDRIEKMGLLNTRKGSFDNALHFILSFCEENLKEFKKWKEKKENQHQKNH